MKKFLTVVAVAIAALVISVNAAFAWQVSGYITCDANGNRQIDEGDLPLAGIVVTVNGTSLTFTGSATTGANGFYSVDLPDVPGSFTLTIGAPAGSSVLIPLPQPFPFSTTDADHSAKINGLISGEACANQACWLTGGGAKFSQITGGLVAEKGPQHNFGGNVNPGCNTESGEGGQWNHVAHSLKRHFQGLAIRVVRCGNVPGIPGGSESPATPFNFIEFEGTGVVKPIQGNKEAGLPADVSFFARAEDRNEPGSNGAKDGAHIDRYFIHVWSGSQTWLLVDIDGNPATIDPVQITDGNLQIHISSCSVPQ